METVTKMNSKAVTLSFSIEFSDYGATSVSKLSLHPLRDIENYRSV